VNPGDLIIVFDDPGKLRQVLTHNETFGYLPLSVKLSRVDMMPAEVHDPKARAAMLAALAADPKTAVTAPAAEELGLSWTQIVIAIAFALAVFGGGLFVAFGSGK